MRALIQRVSSASVTVRGRTTGEIKKGLLVLLSVVKDDTGKDLEYLLKKTANLRIFDNSEGRMNLSVKDVGGEVLVVPQFTLAARVRKGNRPSFDDAAPPRMAEEMYKSFIERLSATGINVKSGVFGEYMNVSLINDGPVTVMVDSREAK